MKELVRVGGAVVARMEARLKPTRPDVSEYMASRVGTSSIVHHLTGHAVITACPGGSGDGVIPSLAASLGENTCVLGRTRGFITARAHVRRRPPGPSDRPEVSVGDCAVVDVLLEVVAQRFAQ